MCYPQISIDIMKLKVVYVLAYIGDLCTVPS